MNAAMRDICRKYQYVPSVPVCGIYRPPETSAFPRPLGPTPDERGRAGSGDASRRRRASPTARGDPIPGVRGRDFFTYRYVCVGMALELVAQALLALLVFSGLALREAVVDRLASLGDRSDPGAPDAPERR